MSPNGMLGGRDASSLQIFKDRDGLWLQLPPATVRDDSSRLFKTFPLDAGKYHLEEDWFDGRIQNKATADVRLSGIEKEVRLERHGSTNLVIQADADSHVALDSGGIALVKLVQGRPYEEQMRRLGKGLFAALNLDDGTYQVKLAGARPEVRFVLDGPNSGDDSITLSGTAEGEELDVHGVIKELGTAISGSVEPCSNARFPTGILVRNSSTKNEALVAVDERGLFSFHTDDPGSYALTAWRDAEAVPYAEDSLMRPYLDKATQANVAAGEHLREVRLPCTEFSILSQ